MEEVVENSVVEEEERILVTYKRASLQESDSSSDDVPSISYKTALESLENFRLENLHISPQQGEQVEALL